MEKMGGAGLQEISHFSFIMSAEHGSSPFDHQSIIMKDHFKWRAKLFEIPISFIFV